MTASVSSTTSSSNHQVNHAKGAHGKAADAGAGDFDELFASLQLLVGSQDPAADSGKSLPLAADAAARLKRVPLGPTVDIITTGEAPPDEDAVISYAREQGVDEQMLALLAQYQGQPVVVRPPDAATPEDGASVGLSGAGGTALDRIAARLDALTARGGEVAAVAADAQAVQPKSGNETQALLQTLRSATQSAMGAAPGLQNGLRELATPRHADGKAERRDGQTLGVQATVGAAPTEAAPLSRVVEARAALEVLAQRRDGLERASSGVEPRAALPEAVESAAIDDLATATVGDAPGVTVVVDDAKPAAPDAPAAKTTAAESPEEAHQRRAEQYQQLSDRLAEAVGRRLAGEIARGAWQVSLQLSPAHLGKIDVRIGMTDDGIEATFAPEQVQTQEMITQSMARLKDALEQAGVNVARLALDAQQSNAQARQGGERRPQGRAEDRGATGVETADLRPAAERVITARSAPVADDGRIDVVA